MTDRELLEAAAKAAGLGLPDKDDTDEIGRQYGSHLGLWCKFPWGWEWFRPHMDDGQALRLAVKLGLVVDCSRPSAGEPYKQHAIWHDDLCDTATLTRRAIVRAAAEIGRQA